MVPAVPCDMILTKAWLTPYLSTYWVASLFKGGDLRLPIIWISFFALLSYFLLKILLEDHHEIPWLAVQTSPTAPLQSVMDVLSMGRAEEEITSI